MKTLTIILISFVLLACGSSADPSPIATVDSGDSGPYACPEGCSGELNPGRTAITCTCTDAAAPLDSGVAAVTLPPPQDSGPE